MPGVTRHFQYIRTTRGTMRTCHFTWNSIPIGMATPAPIPLKSTCTCGTIAAAATMIILRLHCCIPAKFRCSPLPTPGWPPGRSIGARAMVGTSSPLVTLRATATEFQISVLCRTHSRPRHPVGFIFNRTSFISTFTQRPLPARARPCSSP